MSRLLAFPHSFSSDWVREYNICWKSGNWGFDVSFLYSGSGGWFPSQEFWKVGFPPRWPLFGVDCGSWRLYGGSKDIVD